MEVEDQRAAEGTGEMGHPSRSTFQSPDENKISVKEDRQIK